MILMLPFSRFGEVTRIYNILGKRQGWYHVTAVMPDSGTGALENFPHLACTLRRSCVSASLAHAHTQLRPSVHARWGKFSSAPVPNLASLCYCTKYVSKPEKSYATDTMAAINSTKSLASLLCNLGTCMLNHRKCGAPECADTFLGLSLYGTDSSTTIW